MRLLLSLALMTALVSPVQAENAPELPQVLRGTAAFTPQGDQKNVPERYRLEAHRFDWEMKRVRELPLTGVEVFEVRFPSPVVTPHKENNTVHAEYYRPKTKEPFPCVIVLDITGGDQSLSRMFGRHLAHNGIGGLFVQMAYYGPRRPPGSKLKLMSYDVAHTMRAITQTVLDMRRAAAWMEAQPEVDKDKLGILGTSLGSFIAALTGEMEPKLGRVCVLLGGADFVDGYWEHPLAAPYFKVLQTFGGRKEILQRVIAPVDPITCAANLKERDLLIIAARNDEIVPPRMAENLWKASGKQRIVWLEGAGHFTAALYVVPGLTEVVRHFQKPQSRKR